MCKYFLNFKGLGCGIAPLVTSGLWKDLVFSVLKAKLCYSYIPTLLSLKKMMLQHTICLLGAHSMLEMGVGYCLLHFFILGDFGI